jgi:hypothetical protein
VAKVNLNPFHKYDRCSKLMDHRDMPLVYRLEIDKGDISELGREERCLCTATLTTNDGGRPTGILVDSTDKDGPLLASR